MAKSVFEATRRCAEALSPSQGFAVGVNTCRSFKSVPGPGVYVFFNDNAVHYAGEANDVARRLIRGHYNAHIGGSEGVIRSLMHSLDQVCAQRDKWTPLGPGRRR